MILTTHALVGAVLGKNIQNPWFVAFFCFLVHFALDSFRHGEYIDHRKKLKNLAWKIVLDLVFALSLIGLIVLFKNWDINILRNIFLGVLFCLLPDFLTFLHYEFPSFKFLKKVYHFHERVHPYRSPCEQTRWCLRNALNDIFFSLIALIFLLV